jgi:hypothetical protein
MQLYAPAKESEQLKLNNRVKFGKSHQFWIWVMETFEVTDLEAVSESTCDKEATSS